ncbi:MAG: glutamate--tRNA ligase family protein, partial [Chitinophagaceae bacterium]|nr:glutamate--tRNA ligase family protein [Chitinophagaceae bacterium]
MNVLQLKTRIAPTPSGYLHLGNIYSFVLTWLIARYHKGKVLLRIDDLDAERVRREYLEDIFSVLDFIGLEPDEGPSGPEDFLKNYAQHYRLAQYNQLIEMLQNTGKIYPCICSRKQIAAQSPSGVYPGTCRNKLFNPELKNTNLRINLAGTGIIEVPDHYSGQKREIDLSNRMGDFVVRRKDGLPSYQIASLADDLYYKINFVVRGEDLLPSTAAQIHLSNLLELRPFQQIGWHHHPLIVDEQNEKLSKSAGSQSESLLNSSGFSKQ